MYARVTTIEGSPDRMDDAKRHTQEQTLPQLQKMDGFKGFVALGDRHSGKLLGVAFWESEEALRAAENNKYLEKGRPGPPNSSVIHRPVLYSPRV